MNKQALTRARIIYLLLLLMGIGIIMQISYLQFFTDYSQQSDKLAYAQEAIEANRGNILAKDHRFLATSVPYYQLRIDCMASDIDTFNLYVGGLSLALADFYKDKPADAYKKDLLAARKTGNRYKSLGNREIDYSELNQVKKFPLFRLGANRGGIIAEQKNKRKMPYGRLAYRTIGFINRDGVGAGIETSYDFYLKGREGEQIVQRLSGGTRMPLTNTPRIRPVDGFDVQSTIDIDIQEATESALRNQLSKASVFEGATAIVMEVKTGAIRAIANMKRTDEDQFDESYNYAIGAATEPGSTFKLATLIALIEGNHLNLSTMVDAGNGRWLYAGKTFTDVSHGGYGTIDVLTAFEKSSNVAFAQLAVKHFGGKEKEYVGRLYNNMKLNEPLNIELLGEGRSLIRTPNDKLWSKLSLPMMSIGYEVLLTPMHTLTLYNAIANGGRMMKPYFIENMQRYGIVEQQYSSQELSGAICSKSTVDTVQKALRYVVKAGTAKAINDPRYSISGKTGTAQIAFDGKYIDREGYRKHQASFAGFFPSENPRYTMVVVLYTRKTRANFYGGAWAAPVFKQIADKIYSSSSDWEAPLSAPPAINVIPPPALAGNPMYGQTVSKLLVQKSVDSNNAGAWTKIPVQTDSLANVVGMGLRDAVFTLERQGVQVKIEGKGVVVSQDPPANTALGEIREISLLLQKQEPPKAVAVPQAILSNTR